MGVKVREKPKGSGVWWVFINHRGKRKAKRVGSEKAALKVAEKIEAKITLSEFNIETKEEEGKKPTLKEYINGWKNSESCYPGWLNTSAELCLKSSTRNGYKLIIENHLIPMLGNHRLDEIDSRKINDMVFGLFKSGLRSQTVKNVKNCLGSILRQAKQECFIDSSPTCGIIVPTPEDEKPSREPLPFSWDEKDHFEKTVKEHFPRYYPLVVCGLRTGLRIGELIALKWEDIDFYNRLIFVQRNITRGKITTPKSKAGKRVVRMSQQLVEVLKIQDKRQKEEKLKKGWLDLPAWVFHCADGNHLAYSSFVRLFWNKAIEKSKLLKRTPHDMRHTYATLRLSKGDSIAEVSKEMGHGTPDITFKTYYKWMPRESRSSIDELDGTFQENIVLQMV